MRQTDRQTDWLTDWQQDILDKSCRETESKVTETYAYTHTHTHTQTWLGFILSINCLFAGDKYLVEDEINDTKAKIEKTSTQGNVYLLHLILLKCRLGEDNFCIHSSLLLWLSSI